MNLISVKLQSPRFDTWFSDHRNWKPRELGSLPLAHQILCSRSIPCNYTCLLVRSVTLSVRVQVKSMGNGLIDEGSLND